MSTPISQLDYLLPLLPTGQRWQLAHQGESGARLYRSADGQCYAKLSLDVQGLHHEYRRTHWVHSQGLAVPRILDWRSNEQGACLLMSALSGVPASMLTAQQLAQAWPSLIAQLASLHTLPVENCPFERKLADLYALAQDVVSRNAVNPDFLPPEDRELPTHVLLARVSAQMPERLAQEAQDRVVCHGDACMPNFLVDPDTLRCTGMLDLGRLGIADPYVDFSLFLANASETWQNPVQLQAAQQNLFAQLAIPQPDLGRLQFYLQLDPLTWG
jgi:streptomycin 3"-kinase